MFSPFRIFTFKFVWLVIFLLVGVAAGTAWFWSQSQSASLVEPFIKIGQPQELPLLQYSIPRLTQRQFQTSHITVEKEISATPEFTSYLFSYQTLGKKMTGQLNVPTALNTTQPAPTIIMLRGYVPPEIYATGVGTKNAAAYFAKNGFITIAPDFFSYGGSDPEPTDTWQARFEKPITVVELLRTLQHEPLTLPASGSTSASTTTQQVTIGRIGLWAHSNGGQIALTTLEVLGEPIPTTLWAPVTAPFPYSILFFSDESADEGKDTRKYISIFEKSYDVFDFSLTQHLDRLTGSIQLHHGTADEAALKVWSDEFTDKIKSENNRRAAVQKAQATSSAPIASTVLPPIVVTYFTYPGANHNLQPGWDTVVARDVEFFSQQLRLQ